MTVAGTSCRTNTEMVADDPAAGIERLAAGGSVREEVDRLARPLIESGEVEGMVVGVLDPEGGVEICRYGGAGKLEGDAIFEVGSLAKTFVAALLAVLVEEGALKYEDTVRDILPADVPLSEDAGGLTLYELATHSSGLPRDPVCWDALTCGVNYFFTGENLYGYITRPWLYEYLRTCRLDPKPERRVEYSNLGAGLLGHLIEVRTGRSLSELLREKITGPLGMHDTVFALDPERQRRLAVGHAGDHPCFLQRETAMAPWEMGEIMNGACGLYSTLNDLMLFARVVLGLHAHPLASLLPSMQLTRVVTPEEDVALGWIVHHFPECRTSIVYKYGIISGYSAYIGMVPDRRIAVVVLSTSFCLDGKVGHNLLLRWSGALEKRSHP